MQKSLIEMEMAVAISHVSVLCADKRSAHTRSRALNQDKLPEMKRREVRCTIAQTAGQTDRSMWSDSY